MHAVQVRDVDWLFAKFQVRSDARKLRVFFMDDPTGYEYGNEIRKICI